MSLPASAAQAVAEATVAIFRLNSQRPGDYVLVMKSTVDEEGGITYTWDWWWRPPGTLNMEGGGKV